MAMWTVWENPRLEARHERAVLIRDGFAWLAFLFAPLWLLVHRMWLVLIGYLAVTFALSTVLQQTVGQGFASAGLFALSIWFGFEARGLRRWALSRRGYEMMAVVEGVRFNDAERRYYQETAARAGSASAVPAASHTPPTSAVPSVGQSSPAPAAGNEVLGVFPEASR